MKKAPIFKQIRFGDIHPWKDNPRGIRTANLQLLAESIEKHDLFKAFVCWEESGKIICGGGNMRLAAMKHVLNYSDDKMLWISLNFPETEAEKIELSFLDNMKFGFYLEQAVAELTMPHIKDLNIEKISLDMGKPVSLKDVLSEFADVGDGDKTPYEGNPIVCPNCGHSFIEKN